MIDGGAGRGQADQVIAAGDRRQRESERNRGELHHPLEPGQAVEAPDGERRAAIGLVDERALEDRVRRVVRERGDRHEGDCGGKGEQEQRE